MSRGMTYSTYIVKGGGGGGITGKVTVSCMTGMFLPMRYASSSSLIAMHALKMLGMGRWYNS